MSNKIAIIKPSYKFSSLKCVIYRYYGKIDKTVTHYIVIGRVLIHALTMKPVLAEFALDHQTGCPLPAQTEPRVSAVLLPVFLHVSVSHIAHGLHLQHLRQLEGLYHLYRVYELLQKEDKMLHLIQLTNPVNRRKTKESRFATEIAKLNSKHRAVAITQIIP